MKDRQRAAREHAAVYWSSDMIELCQPGEGSQQNCIHQLLVCVNGANLLVEAYML